MTDIRDDVRADFTDVFGHEPAGVWSAPGRVTLLDGDAVSLSVAINRRTVIAVGVRDDAVLRFASSLADEMVELPLSELAAGPFGGWSAYPLGVVRALGELGADLGAVPGVDVFIESTVPVGAGLASSAALTMSVAIALRDVWQLGMDDATLARAGALAEARATGHPARHADHAAVLLGRAGSAVMVDERDGGFETLDLRFDGPQLFVIDPGVETVPVGTGSDERVLEAADSLRAADPSALGALLDAAHSAWRETLAVRAGNVGAGVAGTGLVGAGAVDETGGVPELDLAVETARATGALGARAAAGGIVVAIIPADSVSRLQVALDGAFAEHGFGQPVSFVVSASGGAVREP